MRKTRPKIETPFKCYIYCSKGKMFLYKNPNNGELFLDSNGGYRGGDYEDRFLTQKVIGEFVCDEIIEDKCGENADVFYKDGLMTLEEQKKYGKNNQLYGWHISDLKIYDKPKELGEFGNYKTEWVQWYHSDDKVFCPLTRPPQSWCYVEVII